MQIHPLSATHLGGAHGPQRAPDQANTASPATQTSDTEGTAGAEPGIEITLSEDAAAALGGPQSADRPGNSGNAPAHAVRRMMGEGAIAEGATAEGADADGYKNFGQMASAFVRGFYDAIAPGGDGTDTGVIAEDAAVAPVDETLGETTPLPVPEEIVVEALLAGDEPSEDPADEAVDPVEPATLVELGTLQTSSDPDGELLDLLAEEDGETV